MVRVTTLLIIASLLSALGVVTSQHRARTLVTTIEREQTRTRALDVEWGQLQIEAGTWAAHARVEKIARERLHMLAPTKETQVSLDPLAEMTR